MTWQHLDGDHELPATFSGPALQKAPRSRRRRGVWIILGGLLVVAAGVGVHVAANTGYDDSLASFRDAAAVAEDRQADLEADAEQLEVDAIAASDIVAADSTALI
ncbi:MAG TPA: hypothetical protein VN035_07060, partial [Microbacterium sp.]|nr:hypothetical protein [Microbacterium sp.]